MSHRILFFFVPSEREATQKNQAGGDEKLLGRTLRTIPQVSYFHIPHDP